MTPQAGITHDVVFHVNDSVKCGVIVKPFTYRVNFAPSFIPRYSVGDVRGADRARWWSFLQSRFDGGAGQLYWSGSRGNSKYAESHLIDIGLTTTRKDVSEESGLSGDIPVNVRPSEDLDNSIVGDAHVAVTPRATTGESLWASTLFTADYKMHMVELSNRPHVWQALGSFCYTAVADTFAWEGGVLRGRTNKLTGTWAVMGTYGTDVYVHKALRYSGVIAVALGTLGIRIYGSENTLGQTPSVAYQPSYSTEATGLADFDEKLWRSYKGNVASLTPTANTIDATWSTYTAVGDPSIPIKEMLPFNGKLYFGKPDGLWVNDGGTYFEVESFKDQKDPNNFNLFTTLRGALYFNIRNYVFRLTADGTIELLQTPVFNGAVVDGAATNNELYILVRNPSTGDLLSDRPPPARGLPDVPSNQSEVWVFDPETGGTRKWFSTEDIASGQLYYTPRGIRSMNGLIWLSPVMMSYAKVADTFIYDFPIAAADRVVLPHVAPTPYFAKTHSYLIGSMLDMGMPYLRKQYNKVNVDYTLFGKQDRIDVSYITDIEGRAGAEKCYIVFALTNSFKDLTASVIDRTYVGGVLPAGDGDGETFNYGSTPVTSRFDTMIMGFSKKPTSVVVNMAKQDPPPYRGPITFDATMQLYYLFQSNGLRTFHDDGAFDFTYTFHHVGNLEGYFSYVLSVPPERGDWPKIKASDVASSWGGTDADQSELYWVVWVRAGAVKQIVLEEIRGSEDENAPITLRTQPWTLLGSIGVDSDDFSLTHKEFTLPEGLNSRNIMLRFDFWATDQTRPDIRRYEVEYAPFNSNLRMVDFVALALDNMETEDLATEYSARFVEATLYSLAGSGITQVVELGWPTRHTIRARVQITPPGTHVPGLAAVASKKGFPGADIPVHLDEM